MNKRKIIVIHSVIFAVLAINLLFNSDLLLNYFAPGLHDAHMWINLMIFGTIGMLILIIVSCLIFLRKKKLIGFIIIIINLFWSWFSLKLLYRYNFTEILTTYPIPDWILVLNSIFALIGIVIGFKLINKKVNFKNALLTQFSIITIGITIQIIQML